MNAEAEGASAGAAPDLGEPVEVSSLRRGAPERLGLQDLPGLQRPEGPVPGARSGHHPGAVGGGEFKVQYTVQFEAEVVGWLKEASVKAVGDRMQLSWNAMDGIMQRAVALRLARRETEAVRRLSVDETSFRRRHQYVTVMSNPESGQVPHVAPGGGARMC